MNMRHTYTYGYLLMYEWEVSDFNTLMRTLFFLNRLSVFPELCSLKRAFGSLPWPLLPWRPPFSFESSSLGFAWTWRWLWSWRRTCDTSASSPGPAAWPESYTPPCFPSWPFSWFLPPGRWNGRINKNDWHLVNWFQMNLIFQPYCLFLCLIWLWWGRKKSLRSLNIMRGRSVYHLNHHLGLLLHNSCDFAKLIKPCDNFLVWTETALGKHPSIPTESPTKLSKDHKYGYHK